MSKENIFLVLGLSFVVLGWLISFFLLRYSKKGRIIFFINLLIAFSASYLLYYTLENSTHGEGLVTGYLFFIVTGGYMMAMLVFSFLYHSMRKSKKA